MLEHRETARSWKMYSDYRVTWLAVKTAEGDPLHNVRDGVAHWERRPGDEIESELGGGQLHMQRLPLVATFDVPSQGEVKGTVRPEGRSALAPTWVQKTAAKSKKLAYFCPERRQQFAAEQSLDVGTAYGS